MAGKEVNVRRQVATKRIEFFASTMDAFLQDFLEKAVADDKLGTIVASARLAQLGQAISDEYIANIEALVSSDTELKVAQQAASLTIAMVNKNGEQCNALQPEATTGPAAEPVSVETDKSLN
jgi:hypothetical protein